MINGVHALFYTANPDADRVFFRDVLGLRSVDIGHGWLIFALPPAEAAVHPLDAADRDRAPDTMVRAEVYLMCDDVHETVRTLAARGVACSELATERWGIRTTVPLPSGARIGLYQPTHETAHTLTHGT